MPFEFATAARIIFGAGTVKQTGVLARELGRVALIVTGRDASRATVITELLEEQSVRSVLFPVSGEPDLETIGKGVALGQSEGCDLVVGFGGGSALDAGKAIAAMMTNGGNLLDYVEIIGAGKVLSQAPLPYLAIPTTAGTGSEVTRNAVLTSSAHRVKVSLRSPLMLPKIALVDPGLALSLPPAITAATGMDALTQLIEPYVCSRTNPVTDALCVDGLKRVARSLRIAFANGKNLAAREDMALAAVYGGMALANAGLGAVHGLAGPLGGLTGAAHGAICAALLPHVMAANLAALRERKPGHPALTCYETVARILTNNPQARADDGVTWVTDLANDLKIAPLGKLGLQPRDIPSLTEQATRSGSMKANPVELASTELAAVVEKAC